MIFTNAKIILKQKIADDVFHFLLRSDNGNPFPQVKCGQFVNVQIPNHPEKILRRPFGIIKSTTEQHGGTVTFAAQVKGEGTRVLCNETKEGDSVELMLPLGNGFEIGDSVKKIALVGGGIGVFPLVSVLDQHQDKEIHSFLGYKNKDSAYFLDAFRRASKKCHITSDDGTIGQQGRVTDLVAQHIAETSPDIVLACGPPAMFRSLKQVMSAHPNTVVNVSMEERMGCGFGVCLGCTCKVKNKDGGINHERVCKEGPVFNLNEVQL